jgi:hypothetical protein
MEIRPTCLRHLNICIVREFVILQRMIPYDVSLKWDSTLTNRHKLPDVRGT